MESDYWVLGKLLKAFSFFSDFPWNFIHFCHCRSLKCECYRTATCRESGLTLACQIFSFIYLAVTHERLISGDKNGKRALSGNFLWSHVEEKNLQESITLALRLSFKSILGAILQGDVWYVSIDVSGPWRLQLNCIMIGEFSSFSSTEWLLALVTIINNFLFQNIREQCRSFPLGLFSIPVAKSSLLNGCFLFTSSQMAGLSKSVENGLRHRRLSSSLT